MIRNTSFNVRPDRHTSAEIASLKPEESVIVYDTDEKVNKFWNGTEWVSIDGASGQAGYSHTGAFAGKPLDNNYVWQAGAGINYTQADVNAGTYKVFSLDRDVHLAVDNPYWSTPTPSGQTDIGLFQGANLPSGISSLVDYSFDFDTAYPSSTGTGFEGSVGRIKLNDCVYGDQLRVRFDVTYSKSNLYNGYGPVQIWLMGDGTSDSYANGIRNQVYPSEQNYTKLQLNSMVSNDIQTVNINGLT